MAFEPQNEDVIAAQDAAADTNESPAEHNAEGPAPKGAIVFALAMILVYIGYFSVTWYEIVILRGGAV